MALVAEIVIKGGTRAMLAKLVARTLNGLVAMDAEQLTISRAKGGPIPPLYRSGVVYMHELLDHPDTRQWRSVWDVVRLGGGICGDLAAWRVAELQGAGVDARPLVHLPAGVPVDELDPVTLHALVAVLNTPANVRRWQEVTQAFCGGARFPFGRRPELRMPGKPVDGGNFVFEDPSWVLGM